MFAAPQIFCSVDRSSVRHSRTLSRKTRGRFPRCSPQLPFRRNRNVSALSYQNQLIVRVNWDNKHIITGTIFWAQVKVEPYNLPPPVAFSSDIIVGAAVSKTTRLLSVFPRETTTNNNAGLKHEFVHLSRL